MEYPQVSGYSDGWEWAGCKTVGSAYDGSTPTPATTSGNSPWPAWMRSGVDLARVRWCPAGSGRLLLFVVEIDHGPAPCGGASCAHLASAPAENIASQRIPGCLVLRHGWAVPGGPVWRAASGRIRMGKDEKQTEADRTRCPRAGRGRACGADLAGSPAAAG